jgi:hypothetical protein
VQALVNSEEEFVFVIVGVENKLKDLYDGAFEDVEEKDVEAASISCAIQPCSAR